MARAETRHSVHRTRYWMGGPTRRPTVIGAGCLVNKADLLAVKNRTWKDWWSLVLVTEGGGVYADGSGRRLRVRAGDLICTFPGLAHTYYRRGYAKWSEYHLIFQGDIVRQMERDGLLDRRKPVWRLGLESRAARLLRTAVSDCLEAPVCRHAQAIARVHHLLAEAQAELDAARRRGASAPIRKARELLARNLRAPLDLAAVARVLGLKYDAFRRRFRAEVGVAPHQYRLRRRIEAAQRVLLRDPRPLKAIAYDLGFCNPYFFSAQFKRFTGLPPRTFREGAKETGAKPASA